MPPLDRQSSARGGHAQKNKLGYVRGITVATEQSHSSFHFRSVGRVFVNKMFERNKKGKTNKQTWKWIEKFLLKMLSTGRIIISQII